MSIQLNNIIKRYNTQTIVDNVSLKIKTGEMFVLLGASGSGKSTLLRIIAGLTPQNSGEVFLNERNVTKLRPQQRNVGFVFQNYSLFRHMTVAQNIAFGMEVQRVPKRERDQRVNELLKLIGLEGMGNRLPSQLSGGQQQRVAVARALAHNPNVLLLDEPFGALDVKIRTRLRQNLREIQQQLGVTAVLVTHDQDEAFELADRIGVIDGGKLLEVGTPDQLYRQPANRFTATFLGNANLLQGELTDNHINVAGTLLPLPQGVPLPATNVIDLMVRPESVFLTRRQEDQRSHVLGKGHVVSMMFAGSVERARIRMEQGYDLEVLMNLNRVHELSLEPGVPVWAGIRDYHLLAAN